MVEIFRSIDDAKGYSVSNYGRVRNDKSGRFLQLTARGDKYHRVTLNGQKHRVHRLVAKAFIPNPKKYSSVHHLDGLQNNHVDNLCWGNNGSLALRRDRHSIKKLKDGSFSAQFSFRNKTYNLGNFDNRKSAAAVIINLKGLIQNLCF